MLSFVAYCLFVSNSQVIDCEDRLRNDLYRTVSGGALNSAQSNSMLMSCCIALGNLVVKRESLFSIRSYKCLCGTFSGVSR